MKFQESCSMYFREFLSSVPGDIEAYASRKKQLLLPTFPSHFINELIANVTEIFKSEQTLLEITPQVIVCGDLHGHLLDLLRVLKTYGSPEARQYLFLGDIVDRGEFSIECIVLIYIMKCIWPKTVWIIRGNHEFAYLCGQCGFFSQLTEVYGDMNIFRAFLKSFSYLPLAAMIGQTTLCVHGGLSPSLYSLAQIKNIQRPLDDFGDDDVIDGLLWSDPNNDLREYTDSPRGTGFFFGASAADEFLKANKLKYVVRGHECVPDGYFTHFGSIITVFGASNYCGMVNNYSAVLNFKSDGVYEPRRFPALDYLLRNYTIFTKQKNYTSIEPQSARNFDPRPKEHLPKLKGKTPRVSARHNKFQITPIKRKV